MSIASEITRLQNAKSALKTAINAKGGTLTTETLDQYASAVNALPTPKEEETKTVTPNFASGNVVVTPTSGKVMSQVTINKDSNLIAENIKAGVTIFGVTGTLESGGGGLAGGIYFPVSGSLWKRVEITISGKTTVTMDNTETNYLPIPSDWLNGWRTLNITITNYADSRSSSYTIVYDYSGLQGVGNSSSNSVFSSTVNSVYVTSDTIIIINAGGADPI